METVRLWMDGPILKAQLIIDAQYLLIQPGDSRVLDLT